jgi:soluble lytic murein transglycosylase-like protein
MTGEIVLNCLLAASANYNVPPVVLYSIMLVEGGKNGEVSKNTNNTYDLGIMQINTLWLPELAEHWKLTPTETAFAIVNDPCTNFNVAAWILKKKIAEADGSLINGIAFYHSRTPKFGVKYAMKEPVLLKDLQEQEL